MIRKITVGLVMMLLFVPFNGVKLEANEAVVDEMTISPGFQLGKDLNTDMIFTVTRLDSTKEEVVLKEYFVSKEELRDSLYTFTNDHFALTEGKYTIDVDFPDHNSDGTVNLSKHYLDPSDLHKTIYIKNVGGNLVVEGKEIRFYTKPVFFNLNLSGRVFIDDEETDDLEGIRFTILQKSSYEWAKDLISENPKAAESIGLNYTRTSNAKGSYNIQDYMFGNDSVYESLYVVITELPEGMSEADMGPDFKWIKEINYNQLINAPKGTRVLAKEEVRRVYTQTLDVRIIDEETKETVYSDFTITNKVLGSIGTTSTGSTFSFKLMPGDYDFMSNTLNYNISKIMFNNQEITDSFISLANSGSKDSTQELLIYVKKNTVKVDPETPGSKDPSDTDSKEVNNDKEVIVEKKDNTAVSKTPETGLNDSGTFYLGLSLIALNILVLGMMKNRKVKKGTDPM